MTLRVRTDSFEDFLRDRAAEAPDTPSRQQDGICLLSGQLIKQNLKDFLNREGIQTTPLADFTTIEDLASQILASTEKPDQILSEGIRDRILEEILVTADPELKEDTSPLEHNEVLRAGELTALETLASQLPYREEDTREALVTELDDYFRWTDAATKNTSAIRELDNIESRFAQVKSNRSMSAFRGIERLIQARLDQLDIDRHQSRSHLVHEARFHVDEELEDQYEKIEWVAIATISVFDNPTLRFIEALSDSSATPAVEIFNGVGSSEYNHSRIKAVTADDDSDHIVDETPEFQSEAARELFEATSSTPAGVPDGITFVETPTDQQAVEQVATKVRELVQEEVHPRDILIVAPNAGDYQSLIEQAFETVEIPVHVETRRPYANIPAYRCLRKFVDVIAAVSSGDPLTYDKLVDPLRLGYCPRDAYGDRWPIGGREFTKVEQELHRKQQFFNRDPDRYEDQGIDFSEWRDQIEEIPNWTGPWFAVEEYLDDVEELASRPPESGEKLTELFSSYLGKFVFQTVDHERALYTGPAIDTTRTTLSETHPTSEAELVRNSLDQVGVHYDRVRAMFDVPVSWTEIGNAFSRTLGNQSYGKSHIDQYAVPVVDAGNSHFRDAEYIFILGMNAEEFPGQRSTSIFLHDDLRRSAYKSAISGDTPYHHLDSRDTAYGETLDFYQAALSTARERAEINLYHTYRDERGNDRSWSPFVDLFDVSEDDGVSSAAVDRISVGDWIAHPQSDDESWSTVANRVAPRERLRMLLFHAHRPTPGSPPAISRADLDKVFSTISFPSLDQLILPRVSRYNKPPTSVKIALDEPAFEDVSLEEVTGSPHNTHELDLQAQCGLKYYFYQFLYNFTGDIPEREEIPKYYSSNPHWRLGELPYIVRENYADPRYVSKWGSIVTGLLPERQSTTQGLRQFDSDAELQDWVESQDEFDSYDVNTIYQNLRAERRLVEAEINAGTERTWEWRSGGTIELDGHELRVPAYRLDIIHNGDSQYAIPIFFTRFSNRAMSALKTCYDGAIWEANERTGELCLDCGQSDCTYHSKYVIDHRMLGGYRYESEEFGSKVIGIGLQEQYAGPEDGDRVVATKTNYVDKVQLADTDIFEKFVPRGYPQDWDSSVADWTQNFLDIAKVTDGNSTASLAVNPNIVQRDDCLNCVYRDLCGVPDSEVDLS